MRPTSSASPCTCFSRSPASLDVARVCDQQLRQALLLLGQLRLFLLRRDEPRVRLLDLALERRELRGQRQQLVLDRADRFQLLPRVGHLDGDAVDLVAERFDLAAARDLLVELLVDVAGQRVQRVEPPLDALDELLLGRDARHLAIEIVGDRHEVGRLLRALVHDGELARDGVHPRLELRQPRAEHRRPLEEPLERRAVGREAVAQLHGRGVRLVEVLDFLAQRLEILPALFQVLVLPGGLLGELVDLAERFLERVERGLLAHQVVGLRVERLHLLRQLIDALATTAASRSRAAERLPCPFPLRRSTSAAP